MRCENCRADRITDFAVPLAVVDGITARRAVRIVNVVVIGFNRDDGHSLTTSDCTAHMMAERVVWCVVRHGVFLSSVDSGHVRRVEWCLVEIDQPTVPTDERTVHSVLSAEVSARRGKERVTLSTNGKDTENRHDKELKHGHFLSLA